MTPKIKKSIDENIDKSWPIKLELPLPKTLGELKEKISKEYDLSKNMQNWFIGKTVDNDESTTINELSNFGKNSLYLFMTQPVIKIDNNNDDDEEEVVIIESNNKTTDSIDIDDTDEQMNIEKKDINDDSSIEMKEPEKVETVSSVNVNKIVQQTTLDVSKIEDIEIETIQDIQAKEYDELVMLENCDIVPNVDDITCPICLDIYGPAEAVVLQDCLHSFCWTCLINTIKHSETPEVRCPFVDDYGTCESNLRQREIKALVSPEIFEKHLAKSVTLAENTAGKSAFHCQTPNCTNWCFIDEDDIEFPCGICNKINCLKCRVMHDGMNCYEYQEKLRMSKELNNESLKTEKLLKEMLEKRTFMKCPVCGVILTKASGCDSIICAICKTQLCWPTRGLRWGPGGRGDISGGCRCKVNGRRCHVNCFNCH